MSNTQELCRFDRSGVLNGGPRGRQNTKTRNFLRKKLQKLDFPYGGQTAPSEPAPRVGGTGDVLAGLLPSHSNIKQEKIFVKRTVLRFRRAKQGGRCQDIVGYLFNELSMDPLTPFSYVL